MTGRAGWRTGPWATLGILSLFFASSLGVSWRKWADLQIDFGRELYLPWQISDGQVLYRDLAHLFGPLSQYFNALLFKIFGPSFSVLFITNILLSALFLIGLYWFISRVANRLAAIVSSLAVITVFFFSQHQFVSNFNFAAPYSHEATHGLILSFLMVLLFWQESQTGSRRYYGGAAVAYGLVLLTKVEVAVASSFVVILYFLLSRGDGSRTSAVFRPVLFLAIALIPALCFLSYFSVFMPLESAVGAMVSPWLLALDPAITNLDFYRASMGLMGWADNLLAMLIGTAVVVIPLGIYFFLPKGLQAHGRRISFWGAIGVLFFIVAVGEAYLIRALPLLVLVSIALLAVAYAGSPGADREHRLLPLLMWSVFSFALSFKIILNTRVYHYGFYLTLPSAVTVIVMLTWFLPEWATKPARKPPEALIPTLIVIAVVCSSYAIRSTLLYTLKTYSVGAGADRMVTYSPEVDPRGPLVMEAVGWLEENLDADDTFIVLPEGVILNYMVGRSTNGRHINFMPPEVAAFGEEGILRDLSSHPPDYVVLMHKETAEYGVGYFGEDGRYGGKILTWIRERFEPVAGWGTEPLRDEGFGIRVLNYRSQSPAQ